MKALKWEQHNGVITPRKLLFIPNKKQLDHHKKTESSVLFKNWRIKEFIKCISHRGTETQRRADTYLSRFLSFLCSFSKEIASNGCNNSIKTMATKPSEQQFAQLVKEQKSTIYTVCYMFSKDEDEVADLFEEVLVNLWKGFQAFQGRSNPRTWVYRVSLNTCISADRKRKRRKTIPLSMDHPRRDAPTNGHPARGTP